MSTEANISELIGKTLKKVVNLRDEAIYFFAEDGAEYQLFHDQDCCENVRVEEVIGDPSDLVGHPILAAVEVSSDVSIAEERGPLDSHDESYTWTFYRLATIKGHVTIRFYGTSNGYYSERVTFAKM